MIVVVQVNAPPNMAQGIKEAIAMQLEKYGDTKVISITEELPKQPQQIKMEGA